MTAAIEIVTAARFLESSDVYEIIRARLAEVDETNVAFALAQLVLVYVGKNADRRQVPVEEVLAGLGLYHAVTQALKPVSGQGSFGSLGADGTGDPACP